MNDFKTEMGLHGDDSLDVTITRALSAAQEKVRKLIDKSASVTSEQVDYHYAIVRHMALSEVPSATSEIKIEYFDEEDNLQVFETIPSVDSTATKAYFDFSFGDDVPAISLSKTGDEAEDLKFSEYRITPVQITFSTGLERGVEMESIKSYIIMTAATQLEVGDPVRREQLKRQAKDEIQLFKKIRV